MNSDMPIDVAALLAAARTRLAAAGIDTAALDARLLLQHALDITHGDLIALPERKAEPGRARASAELVEARAARVPLAYLVGRKEFYGRAFAVSRAVLIPRPETEHLLECALALVSPQQEACVLELGVGSGALLVSLLAERANIFGVGVDLSAAALAVAHDNAARHGVHPRTVFLAGDWAAPLDAQFDMVLANPPYLDAAALAACQSELRYEPALALAGGADGLDAYRAIARQAPRLLRPGGDLLFEIGAGQAGAVEEIVRSEGFCALSRHHDYAGHVRIIAAKLPQQDDNGLQKKGLERAREGANLRAQN